METKRTYNNASPSLRKATTQIPNFDLQKGCQIYESGVNISYFDLYLTGEILSPENYTEMINLLRSVGEGTLIRIYINSGGGDFISAVQIINAMRDSKADIMTILDGNAHSAASFIFLNGGCFVVKPGSSMLCHTYSGGEVGKGPDLKRSLEFHHEQINKFIDENYSGFLSTEETERLKNGEDFWLDYNQITSRLENMVAERTGTEYVTGYQVNYPTPEELEERLIAEAAAMQELEDDEAVKKPKKRKPRRKRPEIEEETTDGEEEVKKPARRKKKKETEE